MKKIKWINAMMLIFLFVGSLAAEQSEVIFFNGSVESAREKARKESKLYFIEFYAKWCEPCKWMDENTFKNAALTSYVTDHYVPVKVDVENMDGFVWKQKYKVQFLPTIIVLNGQGTVLGKYEKSLDANDLLNILQNHRSAHGETGTLSAVPGPIYADPTNTSPASVINAAVPVKTTTESSAKPAFITVHREPGLPKASDVAKNTKAAVPPPPAAKPPSNTKKAATTAASEGNGDQYRVQVGVYSDPANVFNEVNRLKKEFNQTVQVFNQKNKETNVVIYKVTVGKFNTKDEATSFVEVLKTKGITGVIRHMSELDPKS